MNSKVDEFLSKDERWSKELALLRKFILDCGLAEDFKWKQPCYTYKGKNIVIIHGFKEYFGIMFFKGVLLKDTEGILIQQTENVQATRQIRFTNTQEITQLETTIKAYVYEAIEIEKAGIKVPLKETSEFEVPEEFQNKLDNDTALKSAFEALTPGRQRGYLLHFSGAKQAPTREERIKKYRQRILDGFGLNDCICGRSKRYPTCDGSHKNSN